MPQINAYVTAAEHTAVTTYAAQFGLDVGALAHLLFRRELRLGRLPDLAVKPELCGRGPAGMKLTAHKADAHLKSRLAAQAQQCGLSLSRACALILLNELNERWLEHSVNGSDSE